MVQTWTKNQVNIQPWQAIPEQMAALGLTDADGMTQVWFVGDDGRLLGGAAAVNGAFWYCVWLRPLTLLYKIPLIHQLENHIYKWVADNRYRMPGSTASCEIK